MAEVERRDKPAAQERIKGQAHFLGFSSVRPVTCRSAEPAPPLVHATRPPCRRRGEAVVQGGRCGRKTELS
jgi:hypothetical protein